MREIKLPLTVGMAKIEVDESSGQVKSVETSQGSWDYMSDEEAAGLSNMIIDLLEQGGIDGQ